MSNSNTNNNNNNSELLEAEANLFFPPPNTLPACAACKHQRRKCLPGCVLAPYFPAHDNELFLNAHKLFGVKKITRALESLHDPARRHVAARSMIGHANARAADPVGGCYRIICELQRQIQFYRAELGIVLNQLAILKAARDSLFSSGATTSVLEDSNNIINDEDNLRGYSDYDTMMMIMGHGDDVAPHVKLEEETLLDGTKGSFLLRNKTGTKLEDAELERNEPQDD